MSIKNVDIVIFGATGFTGMYVVKEFVNFASNSFSWGIAGRSHQKMVELLNVVTAQTGKNVANVPIIVADCSDETSLNNMAQQSKVVINCCGPYRFYGESVVKACIRNGAHHVDVSGEPEYMEKIQLEYNDAAEKNNIYVVSSCGLDSVPADLGVIFFMNNFNGTVNSVESYMKLSSTYNSYAPMCNYGTWESAVYGFANQSNLIDLRKQLYAKFTRPKLVPRLTQRSTIHKTPLFDNKNSIPFPGSDRSVVVRSQLLLQKLYSQRPIQYGAYLVCENWLYLFALMLVGFFLQTLTKHRIGQRLLLRFPEFFSLGIMSRKGVPEEAALRSTLTMRYEGEGWSSDISDINAVLPNKKMITEFTCQSPAYGFTSICLILCAMTILTEPDKLPPRGGVYTPAAAFSKTSLIDKLRDHGGSFKILKNETK